MSKVCRNCNKIYEDDVKFCGVCGGELIEASDSETTEMRTTSQTSVQLAEDGQYSIQSLQGMEKRSLIKCLVYSCITFGIYAFIWGHKFTKDVHTLVGRKTTPAYIMVCIYSMITLGIYGFVYWYKIVNSINEAKDIRNMPGERISATTNTFLQLIPIVNLFAFNQVIVAFNEIVDFNLVTKTTSGQ